MKITSEDFEAYLKVQSSGAYNMFDPMARKLSGLSEDVYFKIIETYEDLMVKYEDTYNKYN